MNPYVFLHDGFADWELAYLLPELAHYDQQHVVTFSLDGGPVTSMGGLRVLPERSVADIDANDLRALLLPGGTFWSAFAAPELAALLHATRARGRCVAAICDATGYLAQNGVLDSIAHTSNSLDFLKERAPHYAGAERYCDALAVLDEGVVTAGGLAPVDFTVKVLECLEVYDSDMRTQWHRDFTAGRSLA